MATVRGAAVEEIAHYPTGTIRWIDVRGKTWAAPGVSFDPDTYQSELTFPATRVRLRAIDPEAIVKGFSVVLEFRNPYYAELFQKRVRERFCPVNATEVCTRAGEQKAADAKRCAEEERLRREAEAKRRAEEAEREREVRRQAAQDAARSRSPREILQDPRISAKRRPRSFWHGELAVAGIAILIVLIVIALGGFGDSNRRNTNDATSLNDADSPALTAGREPLSTIPRTTLLPIELQHEDAAPVTSEGYGFHAAGEYERAVACYEVALEIDPDYIPAMNNMSWLLATCPDERHRNGKRALRLATRMYTLAYERQSVKWLYCGTLAAAYAESGDTAKAYEWQLVCVRMAPPEKRAQANERLVLYRLGKPYRGGPE